MIRALLADDHMLVRAGLKRVLEEEDDIRVIAEAANGIEAIREFGRVRPDVAIVDISMPIMDGLDTCKQLKDSYPDARILILTVHPEEQYAVRLLRAGALGYITKGTSTRELHEAVRLVARGQRFLSGEAKDPILLQLLDLKEYSTPLESISDRELQVLCLLARGDKMKEVAAALRLSVKTVETYRSRILTKLHLRNKADLINFARQNSLL